MPGGVLFALGAAWLLTTLEAHSNYLVAYLPGQIATGAGIGLILPAFTAAAVSTLPPEHLATEIGALTTFRQIGASLGVGAWVALVGTPAPAEAVSAFGSGWAFIAVCGAARGALLLLLRRTPAQQRVAEAVPELPLEPAPAATD